MKRQLKINEYKEYLLNSKHEKIYFIKLKNEEKGFFLSESRFFLFDNLNINKNGEIENISKIFLDIFNELKKEKIYEIEEIIEKNIDVSKHVSCYTNIDVDIYTLKRSENNENNN